MPEILKTDSASLQKTLAFIALNLFGLFLIYLLRDFITPFLGALIFYVLFKPWMEKMKARSKWKPSWLAIIFILLSFFIILIPIMLMSYMLYSKLSQVINDPSSLISVFQMLDQRVMQLTGVDIFTGDNLHAMQAKAANLIPSFLGELFFIVGNILIMYFILYYLLINSDRITEEVNNYLPFKEGNIKILAKELENMTLSNAVGVPLIGCVQGAAAGIGYWIFGLSEPVFWGAITAFVSLLPLIGTTLVWAPAGAFLLLTGETWQGVGMLLYGALVVVNIDNVARFTIQKRFADVHPVITVFGVVIGLDLFGLPGLIFGPLMLSYFVIFVRMYRKIYRTSPSE